MDVPKSKKAKLAGNAKAEENRKQGSELISELVELTDLPPGQVEKELEVILQKAGCQKEDITLEELRTALLGYLESLQDQFAIDSSSVSGN